MIPSVLVALDPGASTGYAVFHPRETRRPEILRECGVITSDHGETLKAMILRYGRTDSLMGSVMVIAEIPGARALWQDRKLWKSIASLNIRAGRYTGIAEALGCMTDLIPVSSWKAGKKKGETALKMKMLYPGPTDPLEPESDAFDAIGLGDYFIQRARRGLLGREDIEGGKVYRAMAPRTAKDIYLAQRKATK